MQRVRTSVDTGRRVRAARGRAVLQGGPRGVGEGDQRREQQQQHEHQQQQQPTPQRGLELR